MSEPKLAPPKLLTVAALCVLGAACVQGKITGQGGTGSGSGGSGSSTTGAGGGVPVVPPGGDPNGVLGGTPKAAAFTPAAPTLRRLTVAQYKNSIRDLLPGVTVKTDLEADTALDGL